MADERVVITYINRKLDTLQETMDKVDRQLRGIVGLESHVILEPGSKKELARRTPDGIWTVKQHD